MIELIVTQTRWQVAAVQFRQQNIRFDSRLVDVSTIRPLVHRDLDNLATIRGQK